QRHDRVDMLDHHGTFMDAGAAGGARPNCLQPDLPAPIAAKLNDGADAFTDPWRMWRAAVGLRQEASRHGGAEVLDQRLRVQRLARRIGWARGFAPPALDAGIEAH